MHAVHFCMAWWYYITNGATPENKMKWKKCHRQNESNMYVEPQMVWSDYVLCGRLIESSVHAHIVEVARITASSLTTQLKRKHMDMNFISLHTTRAICQIAIPVIPVLVMFAAFVCSLALNVWTLVYWLLCPYPNSACPEEIVPFLQINFFHHFVR